MPTIDIHIHYDIVRPMDETTMADWCVFALCIIASAVLGMFVVAVIMYRNRDLMRMRDPISIILMCIGGIIHIWAAFFSNGHLNSVGNFIFFMTMHCPLFDFWMPYVFGFSIWYIGMCKRMTNMFMILNMGIQGGERTQLMREALQLLFVGIIFFFIVIICALVEILHGSSVMEEYGWCLASIYYKLGVILWIFVCWCIMLFLVISMYKREEKVTTAYYETRNAFIVCTVFLVVLAILNFFGILTFWWGRSIYTSLIIFLYVFSVVCLVYEPLHAYLFMSRTEYNDMQRLYYEWCADNKVTMADEDKMRDWLETAFKMFARNPKKCCKYIGIIEMDEDYSPSDTERDVIARQTSYKSTEEYTIRIFEIRAMEAHWDPEMEQGDEEITFEPTYKRRPLSETFQITVGTTVYDPVKIIDLYYALLKFRKEVKLEMKKDLSHMILKNHFSIDQDIFNRISTGDNYVNVNISVDTRRTHTLPLSSMHLVLLYKDLKRDVVLDLTRVYAFAYAVIGQHWFIDFINQPETTALISDNFAKTGKQAAFVASGLASKTMVEFQRKVVQTMQNTPDNPFVKDDFVNVDL